MPRGTKTLYGNIEKEIFYLTSAPIRTHRISFNLIVYAGAGMTANFDTPFTGVFYAMEVRAYHMWGEMIRGEVKNVVEERRRKGKKLEDEKNKEEEKKVEG